MLESSRLAAYIASRICHDLISPVASVNSALELLNDPNDSDMKAEAEQLLNSGAAAATARIQLLRYAFGSAGLSDSAADRHEVKSIVDGFMNSHKADVEWSIETDDFSCGHARVLMNLVILATGSVPRGGIVALRVFNDPTGVTVSAVATGPRAKVSDYTISTLKEEEPEEGWSARTIQPLFTKMVIDDLGGKLDYSQAEDSVTYVASGLRSQG